MIAVWLCASAGAQVIGDIYASDASIRGSVLLASSGAQVMSGSTVGAGSSAAVLRLARGGEVRICPRTNITVNAAQNGGALLLGLSTGSLELHYALAASADSIVTPDFRLLLAGPGTFQFAVAADAQGNTSIRSLPGNGASIIVSELMGDGTYQVRPGEEIVFRGGKVADSDHLVPPDCGCPPAKETMVAAAPAASAPATAPPPPPPPSEPVPPEVHVQVDAPFIFRATDPAPEPVFAIARISLAEAPHLPATVLAPPPPKESAAVAKVRVLPPPSQRVRQKKGFFGRVKAFFAAVFR